MLRKLTSISILILTIYGCQRSIEKSHENADFSNVFYSKNFNENLGKEEFVIIDIDSISKFSDLLNKMEDLSCKNKITGLTFSKDNSHYNLIGYADCKKGKKECLAASSLIHIRNDSIITEFNPIEKIHISKLPGLIQDIDNDNYKFIVTHDSEIPSLIFFQVDDQYSNKLTKSVLAEISRNFDKLDSNFKTDNKPYTIYFTKYEIIEN